MASKNVLTLHSFWSYFRAVFLDLSKAFDRVWHEGLLYKSKCNGINGNVLVLIQNYLILPSYFHSFCELVESVHPYCTRQATNGNVFETGKSPCDMISGHVLRWIKMLEQRTFGCENSVDVVYTHFNALDCTMPFENFLRTSILFLVIWVYF